MLMIIGSSAACALNLVLDVHLSVTKRILGRRVKHPQLIRNWVMYELSSIAPYVIFITVIIISLGFALAAPDVKITVVAYCSLDNHVPGRITAGLVVIIIVAVLCFNVSFYIAFRREPSFGYKGFYRSALIRISSFSLFSLFAIIIGLLFFLLAFIGKHNSVKGLMDLNVILSLMPVAGTVTFGTHKRKEPLNANVQDVSIDDLRPHISVVVMCRLRL
ncbi:MAG: hypothetical protein NXY57DRAFT_1044243 [Lentinula lateritia]|nr:MAG: hypothetical protein NXY57DRAFT_1044243 [Lentinula lateritia]